VSAGVGQEELLNRGAAVASLAYNLSTVRPVELWAIGTMSEPGRWSAREGAGSPDNYNIPCVRIAANPLDPERIAAVLAHPMGARAMMFNLRSVSGGDVVKWAWEDHAVQRSAVKFRERMEPILNLEPEDIVLPGGMLGDGSSEPGQWLNKKMVELGLFAE
jgi:hypothetical protein